MTTRSHNFNAGPTALPFDVLEQAQRELLCYPNAGASVLEISHRSADYKALYQGIKDRLRRLMQVPEGYDILFLQGGASLQFAMVPMNFGPGGAYINTGTWSTRALQEAQRFGTAQLAWSGEADGFKALPMGPIDLAPGTPYLHYTTNNTIYGTQFPQAPSTAAPLIADMSSDILSRPVEVGAHDLIYAGAQKNMGPAGVTVVIGKTEVLNREAVFQATPTTLRYAIQATKDSAYNTPPVFAIYMVGLILEWVESQGGVEAMAQRNSARAKRIYDILDTHPEHYRGHAANDARSCMNITFRMSTPEQEHSFLAEAQRRGCMGLKGHRSVGGLRASLYNAVTDDAVDTLAQLLRDFAT